MSDDGLASGGVDGGSDGSGDAGSGEAGSVEPGSSDVIASDGTAGGAEPVGSDGASVPRALPQAAATRATMATNGSRWLEIEEDRGRLGRDCPGALDRGRVTDGA